jgi:hypothetical protein
MLTLTFTEELSDSELTIDENSADETQTRDDDSTKTIHSLPAATPRPGPRPTPPPHPRSCAGTVRRAILYVIGCILSILAWTERENASANRAPGLSLWIPGKDYRFQRSGPVHRRQRRKYGGGLLLLFTLPTALVVLLLLAPLAPNQASFWDNW